MYSARSAMDEKRLQEIVKSMAYEPIDWQKSVGYHVSKNDCAASVHEAGRGVGHHQCQRKPTEELGGRKWCKQHAQQIKSQLGILDSQIWYISGVKYDSPYVTKIEFDGVKYTETPVVGDQRFYSRDAIKKHSTFIDIATATKHAISELKKVHLSYTVNLSRIEKEISKLEKSLS